MATAQQQLDRPLPNSAEAEGAILGAILMDNSLLAQAQTLLIPEHFYAPSHRRVFEAMISLTERGLEINPTLLRVETGESESWLANLTYHARPMALSVESYAKVVKEKYTLRRVFKFGAKTQAAALVEEDSETLLQQAQQDLSAISVQSHVDSKVRTYAEIADSVMRRFEAWADGKMIALPTQIPELDHKLTYHGLSAQDFIIIAGRSSFGKTALALQIMLNAARSGKSVLIASLEMPGESLFMRNLASVTGVPFSKINPSTFQNDSKTAGALVTGISSIDRCPIQVGDRVNELSQLLAVAREWKRRSPDAGLVIVDYLQLVQNKQRGRTRQEEVAGISIEMKHLAKELDLPVIGVSQLSRRSAQENRKPQLSDLRETGQLEQDADLVLFPWSEHDLEDVKVRQMKLFCGKQRNGAVGWEIDIDFRGEEQWFYTEQMYHDKGGLQN